LKEVATEDFRNYSRQVIANARALGDALSKKGEKFITGGTDNHLLMWDIRPHDLTGSKVEKVLDKMHITTNKNALVGDKS
jgi:glycine hydroxymethyltransferase